MSNIWSVILFGTSNVRKCSGDFRGKDWDSNIWKLAVELDFIQKWSFWWKTGSRLKTALNFPPKFRPGPTFFPPLHQSVFNLGGCPPSPPLPHHMAVSCCVGNEPTSLTSTRRPHATGRRAGLVWVHSALNVVVNKRCVFEPALTFDLQAAGESTN